MLNNFYSSQPINELLDAPDTLAVISLAEQGSTPNAVPLRLQSLGNEQAVNEVWNCTSTRVESGITNGCSWRRCPEYQFIARNVQFDAGDDIEKVTQSAYSAFLNVITESDYPQLVRFWNILPNINHGNGDQENYKQFCSGRLSAFSEFNIDQNKFPAASAVGHFTNGLTLYALTSNRVPAHIANPRQVDAFDYPRQYGPTSPSFARATTLKGTDNGRLCFISGTASILGHSTVHENDLIAQLHTTNDNILYLLKEAGHRAADMKSLRVYLRHPEDLQDCKGLVQKWFPHADIAYTHADICRTDLLVEIEGFCATN